MKKKVSKCEMLACVNGMFKAVHNTERPDAPVWSEEPHSGLTTAGLRLKPASVN